MIHRSKENLLYAIAVLSALLIGSAIASPRIIYVDDDAAGANDGTNWTDAYAYLQDALADAYAGTDSVEIRVAQGLYKPDRGQNATPGNRQAAFVLKSNTLIKGAYAGLGNPDPNERRLDSYRTILSGDLTGNDGPNFTGISENSFHVVVVDSPSDDTAKMDGLVIAHGNDDRVPSLGGGIFIRSVHGHNPIFTNCVIRNNTAHEGGGVAVEMRQDFNANVSWNATFIACRFSGNRAYDPSEGGGYSGAMIWQGGDQYSAHLILRNCVFEGNQDGGVHCREGATVSMYNCVISGGSGTAGHGLSVFGARNVYVEGCTIANNAARSGGGIWVYEGTVEISNSIIWGNTADRDPQIWLYDDTPILRVVYSNIQGGWPGQGNIDADPGFADPNSGDFHLKSQEGRWDAEAMTWLRDDVTSPCIDAGNPASSVRDEPAPNGEIINMGAYGGTTQASKSYPAPPGFYGGGSGTPEDPFQIWDEIHMQAIGADPDNWDKHFILMADIDLSRYTTTDFNLIGYYWDYFNKRYFAGVFDGSGHTISNFTHKSEDRNYVGLFAYVAEGAHIKNLGLIDPNVDAGIGDYVGALIGANLDGVITNCFVERGSVRGDNYVGGLAGQNNGVIESSYSTGNVSGTQCVGGLVGRGSGQTIFNSYSAASIKGDHDLAGLVGDNNGTIVNCYAVGDVTGRKILGGLTAHQAGHVISSYWDIETSGRPTSTAGEGKTTTQMMMKSTFRGWGNCATVWTIDEGRDYPRLAWQDKPGELLAEPFPFEGDGNANSPYLINTPEQLRAVGLLTCTWDKHFRLTADIDLPALQGTNFSIIGCRNLPFTGVFDGNDYAISNLTYDLGDIPYRYVKEAGFLGFVDGERAEIRNLGLIDPHIDAGTTGNDVGALVGELIRGKIIACYADGGRVTGSHHVGGLVGSSYGAISDCYSTATVGGYSNVGGLAGTSNEAAIANCYSSGAVWGYSDIGGLLGYNDGAIRASYAGGTVSGYSKTGGLAGYNNRTIDNCYSVASVFGQDSVGGLVGYAGSGIIANCYSSGAVSGESDVGGLLGGAHPGGVLNSFWDVESSGQLTSAGGTEKTTTEMQRRETFTDAGWDFAEEADNGYEDTWRLCNDAGQYPKLSWQYLPGGFVCPDIVDFADFAHFAYWWHLSRCGKCGGTDLTGDGIVNTLDLMLENDRWLTGTPPSQAGNLSPFDGATSISTDSDLKWQAASFAESHDVYFGSTDPPPFMRNQTDTVFDPGPIDANTTCYWRIDELNKWGKAVGPIWTFTTGAPGQATNPDPFDGRNGVGLTSALRWTPAPDAISHDVYFGTTNPPPFLANQGRVIFYPLISPSATYYWRVDEVSSEGTTTGTVWSFTARISSR